MVREGDEDWAGVRGKLYGLALTCFREVRHLYAEDEEIRILDNRHGERWLPLLALAKFAERGGVSGLLRKVREYAVGDGRGREKGGLSEWDQALLLGLRGLVKGEVMHLSTAEMVKAMREYLPEEEGAEVTARYVGRALQRLDFRDKRRQARGYVYRIRRAEVEDRMERYEVEPASEEGV